MDQDEKESQVLQPILQGSIAFHGKPLIAVRLPDGEFGVVLRWMCENLRLDTHAQVQRIKRTEVIADDLIYVRIQTDGGPQVMPALVLHSVPYWLATIDTRRMEKDDARRLEIFEYQRKAADALYEWAQSIREAITPATVVPEQPIIKPEKPDQSAPLAVKYLVIKKFLNRNGIR